LDTTVNAALNSTLSRTLNTSLTTLLVLLAIFIFGGESIRGFMFALIIGVIVGTYSSVFIATPVMYDTQNKKALKE
jgi:SecD/SecF fusion protein